jgi:hypothetical protein
MFKPNGIGLGAAAATTGTAAFGSIFIAFGRSLLYGWRPVGHSPRRAFVPHGRLFAEHMSGFPCV